MTALLSKPQQHPLIYFSILGLISGIFLFEDMLFSANKVVQIPSPPIPQYEIIGTIEDLYFFGLYIEGQDQVYLLAKEDEKVYSWFFVSDLGTLLIDSPRKAKDACTQAKLTKLERYAETISSCYTIKTLGEIAPGQVVTIGIEDRAHLTRWWLLEESRTVQLLGWVYWLGCVALGLFAGVIFDIVSEKRKARRSE